MRRKRWNYAGVLPRRRPGSSTGSNSAIGTEGPPPHENGAPLCPRRSLSRPTRATRSYGTVGRILPSSSVAQYRQHGPVLSNRCGKSGLWKRCSRTLLVMKRNSTTRGKTIEWFNAQRDFQEQHLSVSARGSKLAAAAFPGSALGFTYRCSPIGILGIPRTPRLSQLEVGFAFSGLVLGTPRVRSHWSPCSRSTDNTATVYPNIKLLQSTSVLQPDISFQMSAGRISA